MRTAKLLFQFGAEKNLEAIFLKTVTKNVRKELALKFSVWG